MESREGEHQGEERESAPRPVQELTELAALLGATLGDMARLLGLETRLALRTLVILVLLGALLVAVVITVWCGMAVLVAAALYEFSRLGLTASIGAGISLWVVLAAGIAWMMRRLSRRLRFAETRLALRTLWAEAARGAGGQP